MTRIAPRFGRWRHRRLLLIAETLLFAALCLTAANELEAAGDAALLGLIPLAAFGIQLLSRRLPVEGSKQAFSRPFLRRSIIGSAVLATAVSLLFWFGGWDVDLNLPPGVIRYLRLLDFIPSAFSLLLPPGWRSGLHSYFRTGTYCFPGPFWWESMRYLRTAIPAYALSFLVVCCGARLASKATRR